MFRSSGDIGADVRDRLRCSQGGRIRSRHETLLGLHHVEQVCFDMLVWYEEYSQVVSARMREVELKGWRRQKKLDLILAENPDWADLSLEWQDNPGWKLEPDARRRMKRKPP